MPSSKRILSPWSTLGVALLSKTKSSPLPALSTKPVAPEDTPVILSPVVIPVFGVSDNTNSVNILMSKRYALKIASLSSASVNKFVEPVPEFNSNPLTLATPIRLPERFG